MLVRIGLPAFLVAVLAVLIWVVGDHLNNAAAIRRLEASARQRGEPLTLAEIAATYPSVPDELLPHFLAAIPLDPFDGKALRYHRKPDGFVVFSIGADGRANGGMERPEKRQVKEFDDTFSVGH